jgi:hypothetical protein
MQEDKKLDPGHAGKRDLLRVIGPSILAVGLLFTVIGMVSFFSAIGSFEPPRYFWCCSLGLPLIFLGTVLGYLGAVTRYVSGESAPVAGFDFKKYGASDEPINVC